MIKKYRILLWVLFPIILLAAVNTLSHALEQNPDKSESTPDDNPSSAKHTNGNGARIILTSGH